MTIPGCLSLMNPSASNLAVLCSCSSDLLPRLRQDSTIASLMSIPPPVLSSSSSTELHTLASAVQSFGLSRWTTSQNGLESYHCLSTATRSSPYPWFGVFPCKRYCKEYGLQGWYFLAILPTGSGAHYLSRSACFTTVTHCFEVKTPDIYSCRATAMIGTTLTSRLKCSPCLRRIHS